MFGTQLGLPRSDNRRSRPTGSFDRGGRGTSRHRAFLTLGTLVLHTFESHTQQSGVRESCLLGLWIYVLGLDTLLGNYRKSNW